MGNPAARAGDFVRHNAPHCHAPIHPPAPVPTPLPHPPQPFLIVAGCPTVTIGGKAAARVGDQTANCNLASCVPGGPGIVLVGSGTVTIGGKPAARVGDLVSYPGCVGPIPSPLATIVAPGLPTVTIG
jgi:uncharacterized Zn-binding protein involved in type VI secretion